eukprot:TRINITY_DN9005_c0_g1_i2.p2 TRINITY_DN9005_c0_g1~~TRINITY_DN9005_c0_g1_i2.p2  ORF type:complete len:157 (+),score=36.48 TRINITY_DN9005_c0_g1_i2:270-740(+)
MVLGRLAPLPGSVRGIGRADRAGSVTPACPPSVMLFTDGHADADTAEDGQVVCGQGIELYVVDAAEAHPENITKFPEKRSHLFSVLNFSNQFATREVVALLQEMNGVISTEMVLEDEAFARVPGCDQARWKDPETGRTGVLLWHTGIKETDFAGQV